MFHPKYYVIKPSSELVASLKHHNETDFTCVLLEPVLWSRDWSDRPEDILDRLTELKLLFLAYLSVEYSANPEFGEIFENLEFSSTQFDKWWTVEEYDLDVKFEDVVENLTVSSLTRFNRTGRPLVDRWVSYLKEKKGTVK